MDSREYSAPSNETMSTTDPETQWNRQIFIPVLKQEIKNEIDEYSSEHSQLPNHVNYYDNKTHVFEQVKEELPGDEYPQADCSMNNSKHSENNRLVNLIDSQNIKNEHSEELPLNIKQEKRNEMYEVTIKLERLDKEEILDNAEDTSVYYDVQATPQETHHKSCGRTLKNSIQQSSQWSENIIIETGHDQDNLNTSYTTINVLVNNNKNNKKKERQQRYREQNREKLKQREAERRKRIKYLLSFGGSTSSTCSNINRKVMNNEETIYANCQSTSISQRTSSIQRDELCEKNNALQKMNALQKKRERQQRYREQNREKLKQREAERRQRLQNSKMVTKSSTFSNIEFTEII